MKSKNPEIRYLNEMKKVLYDQFWAKNTKNFPAYYIWRGIKEKDNLRYDITLIPAKMFGKEFPKTKGHEHIGKFSELYIVLSGKAIYLMQKRKGESIEDIFAIEAKRGEGVVVPPFYGHITINPGKRSLKMANWCSKDCQSNYKVIEEKRGAGYFYTKNGWIKNKNYKKVAKLRFERPLRKIPSFAEIKKLLGEKCSG